MIVDVFKQQTKDLEAGNVSWAASYVIRKRMNNNKSNFNVAEWNQEIEVATNY